MAFMANAREERIRAKAHALWEADGKPEGRDRQHWEQAAKLVEEEERQAARAQNDPEADKDKQADDPIGVTLTAMKTAELTVPGSAPQNRHGTVRSDRRADSGAQTGG